jgi:hypothetical protein
MAISLLGQGIFTLGVEQNTFYIQYIGRFIFGAGAESIKIARSLQIKMFIPEHLVIVWSALAVIMTRLFQFAGAFVRFNLYRATHDFLHPLFCSLSAILVGAICYIYHNETTRCREAKAVAKKISAPFKLTDCKRFPLKFWLVLLLDLTTYGVYGSFHPMFTQILEAGMDIPHSAAADIVTFIPVVQIVVFLLTMCISLLIKNETWLIWIGAIGCIMTVGCIPLFQLTGEASGWAVMIMHATYSAVFMIIRLAVMIKVTP